MKAAQPGSALTSGRGPRDDGGDQPPLNYGVRRGPSEVVWATPSIRAGRRRGPIQTATRVAIPDWADCSGTRAAGSGDQVDVGLAGIGFMAHRRKNSGTLGEPEVARRSAV
jgi:hypothetical protein